VKEFLTFVTSNQAGSILKAHNLLPYADGTALAAADAGRRAKIASTVGTRANVGQTMTTPTVAAAAAPAAASEAAKEAVKAAPAVAKGKAAAATKAAAAASAAEASPFAHVVASVTTTAHQGFSGVRSDAFTSSDNAKIGGKFAKVTGDAVTVAGKNTAKPAVDSSEKSNKVETPKVAAEPKPAAKAAAAAPKAAVAKAEPKPAAGSKTYKVAAGDTLYSIAKKNNVDVNQLRAMNGLKDNNVKLGQTLKVSAR
jgi:phosphate transport system substrate-binding protein